LCRHFDRATLVDRGFFVFLNRVYNRMTCCN
jgi:hypothetical protein